MKLFHFCLLPVIYIFLENNHLDVNGNIKYDAFHPSNPNRLTTNMKDLLSGIPPRRGPIEEFDFRFPYMSTDNDID